MDLEIEGRTAVVTGASRGIGAATAAAARGRGRARSSASRAATGIDVTAPDAAERIAELRRQARSTSSSTTPGTSFARSLDELTDEEWHGQWELHVMASMRLMRAFAPGDGRARVGADRQRLLLGGQAPVADQRRVLGDQGRPALALARVRRHLRRARACSSTPSRPAPWRARCGWPRAAWPTRRGRAKGISREEALEVQAARIPIGRFADRGGDRRRRRVPVLRARVDRRRRRLVGRRRHRRDDRLERMSMTV